MEDHDGEVYIGARVEPSLSEDLKELARLNSRNVSQEIRRALRLWVLAELPRARKAGIDD